MKTVLSTSSNQIPCILRESRRCLALFLFTGMIYLACTSAEAAYFVDDFTYGQPMDARWTNENSPNNAPGTDLTIVNWGDGVAQANGTLNNVYNHLETSIDASGKFSVESNMRQGAVSSWAASLMVYWDTTHWIRFAQFGNYTVMYNDGAGDQTINSSVAAGGDAFNVQRIEFGASTIKFYGAPGNAPGNPPAAPTYIPALDIARGAWSEAPNALLIVGKGYQGFGYNIPDFNNDYITYGAADYLGIDYVSYAAAPVPEPVTCLLMLSGALIVLGRRRNW